MSGDGARRGYAREALFAELINDNSEFRKILTDGLNDLDLIRGEVISAQDVKRNSCKSDVILEVRETYNSYEMGCSLKAAAANFNQLDRRWLSDWEGVLEMPQEVIDSIQSSLDRKRIRSRDVFISPDQESLVLPFIEDNLELILLELFTRDDENLNVFVTYDENRDIWTIARIDDLINVLLREPISTSGSGVVYIGDCLTLQRKGGDGNITHVPKTSPMHPSNHLQFKIKPLTIINKVHSIPLVPRNN
ncbi:hypothetical protein [Neobacillus sp. SAB-20_R2A]|uniref:hypothetical protein n=1 Tax=Neobacillus sp. SAB-20_R2A TaxID=3120519 RepID=UPI003C6DE8AC